MQAQKDLVHDKAQVATSEKSNPLQKVAGRPVMFGKIPGELERFADDQTVFSTSTVAEPVEVPGAVIVPKIGGAGKINFKSFSIARWLQFYSFFLLFCFRSAKVINSAH